MNTIIYSMMLAWSMTGLVFCIQTDQWVWALANTVVTAHNLIKVHIEYQNGIALEKKNEDLKRQNIRLKKALNKRRGQS